MAKPATKAATKTAPTKKAPAKQSAAAQFVWYDVMTTDMPAAQKFYTGLTGWTAKDSGMDDPYVLFSKGATMIGGLMPIPDDARKAGVPPAWMGYIGVADVDAMAKKVVAAGGAIHKPPQDIPGIGRFAVCGDPHGAGFIIFKSHTTDAPAPIPAGTPGHMGWHELFAGDLEQAFKFYAKLFGWKKDTAVETPMGPYQLFSAGGPAIGGMMTKPPQVPVPHWLYYINVAAVNASIAKINKAGGQVLMGPHQVPGGSHIAQCRDPQGAHFAIVGPKL
jgi:uncharacterized protein